MNDITINQFLGLISDLAAYLLPVLGFIALVYLIIFIKRLIKIAENTASRIGQLESTIELVDENLKSLTTTTNSVANMAESLDSAHQKSKGKINEIVDKTTSSLKRKKEQNKFEQKKADLEEIEEKLNMLGARKNEEQEKVEEQEVE